MARDVSWRTPKRRLFSTPLPAETRTYKPVSHKQLAKSTLKAIRDAGFELGVEEYYSSKEGKVATARYTINSVGTEEYFSAREGLVANARYTISDIADADMQLELGWQNSYDKTLSLKFAIGTRIMICENGCVSGNFGAFSKKHMGDIRTFAPHEMKEAIVDAAATFASMIDEKDAMKDITITHRQKAEIIGRLFLEKKYIGSTQLNIIKDEIDHPTHDYMCPNSLWELYQYVTFSMKELHPRSWMDDHINVHQFFAGFIADWHVERISEELKIERRRKAIKTITTELDLTVEPEFIDPNQTSLIDLIEDSQDNG